MGGRRIKKRKLDEAEQQDLEESSSSADANAKRADVTVSKRIVVKTCATYSSNFLMIEKICCQEHVPGTTVNGKLTLPMSLFARKSFLGFVTIPREDGSVKSESTVRLYF